MLGEIGLEGELLEAAEAGERLHLRVGLDVSSQVALVRESLRALVARERLLSGVCPDVALEQPRPGEGFSAEGAPAALDWCMRAHVHCQGGWRAALRHAVVARLRGLQLHLRGAEALHHPPLGHHHVPVLWGPTGRQIKWLGLDLIGRGRCAGRRPRG